MVVMLVIVVSLLGIGLSTNESGKTYLEQYFGTGKQLIHEQLKLDSLESESTSKKLECDLLGTEDFYGDGTCIEDLKTIEQKKSEVLRNMVQLKAYIGLR